MPHPHEAGGSGRSSQSHCVSCPAGCLMIAFARPVAPAHAAQLGRRFRDRISRVNV